MKEIKLLQKLGFTEYEARAYLSLAKLGPSSVREIVFDSKLPRNKAYEALQRLEHKGKVACLLFSPRRYKIINTDTLKEEVQEITNSLQNLMELMEQPKTLEYQDLFWIIRGRKPLIDKFTTENEKAEKEILSCSELDKIIYKNMRIIKEKTKQGVKVRFITTFNKKNISYYRAWQNCGVSIRIFNQQKFGLMPRITIIDSKLARMTVGMPEIKNEGEYITLWTESKAFSAMLQHQFNYIWANSKPLEKYSY